MTGRDTTTRISLQADGNVLIDLPKWPWVFRVRVAVIDGYPHVVELHVEPKETVPARDIVITSERLRGIPLRQLREAAASVLELDLNAALSNLKPDRRRPGQPFEPEHFRQVALVYEKALEAGKPPRAAIQEKWGVSRAAASKWIREAREQGLLGWPERAGVAGTTKKATKKKGR